MFTRASSLLLRAAASAGVVACAAAFVGVAHAGTPADAVTATVATATQPAAATVAPEAAPAVQAVARSAAVTNTPAVPSAPALPSAPVVPKAPAAPSTPAVPSTPTVVTTSVAETAGPVTTTLADTKGAVMTTVANTTGAVTKTTAETVAVAEKAIPITAVTQVGKQAPTETLGVVATTVIDPVASRADDASGSLAASRGNGTEAAGSAPEAANVAVTGVAETASSAGAPRMSNRPRSGRTNAHVLNATSSFLSSGAAAAEVARTPGIQTRGSGPLPRPHHTGFFGVLAAFGEAPGGGGLLLFGLLGFLFLLVIPNAVRWLRPALALGLSPAYVATRDRPG